MAGRYAVILCIFRLHESYWWPFVLFSATADTSSCKTRTLRLWWHARTARAHGSIFNDVKLGHGDCVRGSFVVFFELTRLLQKWFLGAPTCTYSRFILVPRVVKHFSVTFELAMATMANVPMQCVQLCCAVRLQDAIL